MTKNPKGAGRKPVPDHFRRKPFNCRLPASLLDELERRNLDKGPTTEEALIKLLKVKEPK